LGLAIRGLGKKDEYRLLRYGPMAIADLAAEWFETEQLRAIIAARGIFGAFRRAVVGGHERSPSAASRDRRMHDPTFDVRQRRHGFAVAGVSQGRYRSGRRDPHKCRSCKCCVKDGKATGVVLTSGEEIAARARNLNADPRTTFMKLVDPAEFDPSFLNKIRNYRAQGTVAKVHLALSALPQFLL